MFCTIVSRSLCSFISIVRSQHMVKSTHQVQSPVAPFSCNSMDQCSWMPDLSIVSCEGIIVPVLVAVKYGEAVEGNVVLPFSEKTLALN